MKNIVTPTLFRPPPSTSKLVTYYCFCYVRKHLESHMERAKSGIRFITPDYKEKFRIADGDKIRVTTADGEYKDSVCDYIDDYHMVSAQNIYHICEFAELMERQGSTVIPLRSSLTQQCYATLQSTGELIIIRHGDKGYYRCEFSTADKAFNQELAGDRNEMLGVTKAQVSAMLAGSMFGWEVAAADPQNYDDNGYLITKLLS